MYCFRFLPWVKVCSGPFGLALSSFGGKKSGRCTGAPLIQERLYRNWLGQTHAGRLRQVDIL